jgi:predicted DNA binding CopG/RHH family protein
MPKNTYSLRPPTKAEEKQLAKQGPQAGRRVSFPNLKPSREQIALRIPTPILEKVRRIANRRGMPYQSLVNGWIAERADAETSKL